MLFLLSRNSRRRVQLFPATHEMHALNIRCPIGGGGVMNIFFWKNINEEGYRSKRVEIHNRENYEGKEEKENARPKKKMLSDAPRIR